MENKNLIVTLLALGFGLSGIGLGTYATVVRGPPGPPGQDGTDGNDGTDGTDGMDAPGFYCFTETEIQIAIATIGFGSGVINIMEDILLSSAIDVNGGGLYIIQGYGLVTIQSPISDAAFNITSTRSCILRDLIIDASKATLNIYAIRVTEKEKTEITIDNVHIFDGEDRPYSSGIYISSENVVVRNCRIESVQTAIWIDSNHTLIYDNIIFNTSGAITIYSCFNSVIRNNYIEFTGLGIDCVNSNFTVISYNIIKEFGIVGIYLRTGFAFMPPDPGGLEHNTFHNEIVGNQISVVTTPSLESNRSCIWVQDSEENQIIGNYCFKCTNQNPSYYGMGISFTDADNNYIATNTFIMNDVNFYIDSSSTGNILVGNVE